MSPTPSDRQPPHQDRTAIQATLWRPIVLIWAMLFFQAFGVMVSIAPQTRLFEDIACRRYLGSGDQPDEELCKDPAVQDIVNELFGWQLFFDGIPGLVMAMYYGAMADGKGRRPVLMLSLVGQALGAAWILLICWSRIDPRWTWLSSAFYFIGGGGTVFNAAAMMILTDASLESFRSKAFFYAQGVTIVGEMLAPPLGAYLMDSSLWAPIIIGFMCLLFAVWLTVLMPETRFVTLVSDSQDEHGLHGPVSSEPAQEAAQPGGSKFEFGIKSRLESATRHTLSTLGFVLHHRNLVFLMAGFFSTDFAQQSLTVLTVDFQASYLFSFQAFGQMLAYGIILPLLDTTLVSQVGLLPRVKDLYLSQLSVLLLAVSFAVLAFAPKLDFVFVGIAIYTLGTGFQSFARSLVSSLVDADMIGTVFTALAIMDTLAILLAGPAIAAILKLSMRLEGVGKGLPYFLSLALCGLTTIALAQVRVKDPNFHDGLEDEEQRLLPGGEDECDDRGLPST
ncbi:hypothetical protein DHEL01_v209838 [Diaporthe helianthi]|uniref:Major facilitator superfamily (MFS) profile domain-containing protein n=1 Tax=Diaporthe helianthi TaxID=158607 RepID=A0A2P5HNF7_DIAHE|nr:hypothetical protein DHEL01_v209838 [Diaporthe helianthi]